MNDRTSFCVKQQTTIRAKHTTCLTWLQSKALMAHADTEIHKLGFFTFWVSSSPCQPVPSFIGAVSYLQVIDLISG